MWGNVTVKNGHDPGFPGQDGIKNDSSSTTFVANIANDNFNLGIDSVPGVVDGGRNRATGNGNPLQCVNVACSP